MYTKHPSTVFCISAARQRKLRPFVTGAAAKRTTFPIKQPRERLKVAAFGRVWHFSSQGGFEFNYGGGMKYQMSRDWEFEWMLADITGIRHNSD